MAADSFPAFFEAVWGHQPFPWQARLAQQVLATGEWPDLVDVPTGAGKTAVIDVALFALAQDPQRFPRRIVYVVDRRIIIDQVGERVRTIRDHLGAATEGVLYRAARQLRSCFGADAPTPPIHLAELRGGIAMDRSWTLRPDVPAVLVSTVDQVGSRLLHRGYGVSDAMLPVHAGLTGNDCFYVLDEVHLSQPFAQTLHSITTLANTSTGALPIRFGVVQLSATPGSAPTSTVGLDPEDRDPERTPILARRLAATKIARLHLVGSARQPAQESLVPKVLDLARDQAGTVGIIVNRVATARTIATTLADAGEDVLLVTGRMRPHERDQLLARHEHRLRTGRTRDPDDRRFFLVGTQCLEVGADFDLDALVTECASWDALRQRFGRVDRDGHLAAAGTPATIHIVKANSDSDDDPVYGAALNQTWTHLSALGDTFDAGPESPVALPARCLATKPDAPLLLRHHWTAWAQTRPRPHVEPDPALWLHGPEPMTPDVAVVWRSDLDRDTVAACRHDDHILGNVETMLRLLPPVPGEAAPVPLHAVRAWLCDTDHEVPVADTEATAETSGPRSRGSGRSRPALRLRGGDVEAIDADQIRPGDTLVVPAIYGGLHLGTWAPTDTTTVLDIAAAARIAAGRSQIVRLHDHPGAPVPEPQLPLHEQVPELLEWTRDRLHRVPRMDDVSVIDYRTDDAGRVFYVLRFPLETTSRPILDATAGLDHDGSDERNSFTGATVALYAHCEGVGALAAELATRLGFSAALCADLRLAGELHDLGKADPRFQRWLTAGIGATEPVAKSTTTDPRAIAVARQASGYPRGARHELTSLALAASDPSILDAAHDADLVAHLIASHHGWCRPWAPAVPDPDPVEVRADHHGHALHTSSDHGLGSVGAGVADRFFVLLDRYGWHGLAWIETVLRLADHRRSELEETR